MHGNNRELREGTLSFLTRRSSDFMLRLLAVTCVAALLLLASAAAAEGDPKRGDEVYRACVACHALEPDLHLSGPSLDGFWGRQAGTAESFGRYSAGLKRAGFEWNAAALDGWLEEIGRAQV